MSAPKTPEPPQTREALIRWTDWLGIFGLVSPARWGASTLLLRGSQKPLQLLSQPRQCVHRHHQPTSRILLGTRLRWRAFGVKLIEPGNTKLDACNVAVA